MRHALAAIALAIGAVALFIAVRGMMGSPPEVPVAAPLTPLEEKVVIAEQPAIPVAKAAVEVPPPAEPAPKPKVSTWQDTPEKYIRRVEFKAENTTSLDTKRELYLEIFALQKQEHDHEAADAALLRAAQIAEQRPAGEIDARTQRPSQYTGKEGGAYTILREAQLEIVKKDYGNARRHLNMVVEKYSEVSPIASNQAKGHLKFLDEAAGKAKAEEANEAPKNAQTAAPTSTTPPTKSAAARFGGDQEGCHQTQIVDATAVANTVVFTGAKANVTYTITANGTWAQDPDPSFNTGPEGFASFGNIQDGPFTGMFFGSFAVKAPGSSQWIKIGANGTITPTQDGDILGSFADGIGAFGDNNGYMFVTTVEAGCDEEPTPPGQAPTAVLTVNPEISDLTDYFAFGGSQSFDNDEGGAMICLYTIRIRNLTHPEQQDLVYQSSDQPNLLTTFSRGGEYEVTLQVVDNEGDTATTTKNFDVVEVEFDPPSLTIELNKQGTTHAMIIPSSGFDKGITYYANAQILSPLFLNATAPAEDLTFTGTVIGSTSVVAVYNPRESEIGNLAVTVSAAQTTLPPTAVATTTTPLIATGGVVSLDGSGSFDNDSSGPSPEIRKFSWKFENLSNPTNAPFVVTDTSPLLTQTLTTPGDYLITLIVEDNDLVNGTGQVSIPENDSFSQVRVIVVAVTFSPPTIDVETSQSATVTATIEPASVYTQISFIIQDTTKATVNKLHPASAIDTITVTGLIAGETELIAQVPINAASTQCGSAKLLVRLIPGVDISPAEFCSNSTNLSFQAVVSGIPDNATATLRSNNPAVFAFGAAGENTTPVQNGTVELNATTGPAGEAQLDLVITQDGVDRVIQATTAFVHDPTIDITIEPAGEVPIGTFVTITARATCPPDNAQIKLVVPKIGSKTGDADETTVSGTAKDSGQFEITAEFTTGYSVIFRVQFTVVAISDIALTEGSDLIGLNGGESEPVTLVAITSPSGFGSMVEWELSPDDANTSVLPANRKGALLGSVFKSLGVRTFTAKVGTSAKSVKLTAYQITIAEHHLERAEKVNLEAIVEPKDLSGKLQYRWTFMGGRSAERFTEKPETKTILVATPLVGTYSVVVRAIPKKATFSSFPLYSESTANLILEKRSGKDWSITPDLDKDKIDQKIFVSPTIENSQDSQIDLIVGNTRNRKSKNGIVLWPNNTPGSTYESGFEVAQVDDPDGPNNGYWYIKGTKLSIPWENGVSDWIKPKGKRFDSPLGKSQTNFYSENNSRSPVSHNMSGTDFLAIINAHENSGQNGGTGHWGKLLDAESTVDAAERIEDNTATDSQGMVNLVTNTVKELEDIDAFIRISVAVASGNGPVPRVFFWSTTRGQWEGPIQVENPENNGGSY